MPDKYGRPSQTEVQACLADQLVRGINCELSRHPKPVVILKMTLVNGGSESLHLTPIQAHDLLDYLRDLQLFARWRGQEDRWLPRPGSAAYAELHAAQPRISRKDRLPVVGGLERTVREFEPWEREDSIAITFIITNTRFVVLDLPHAVCGCLCDLLERL